MWGGMNRTSDCDREGMQIGSLLQIDQAEPLLRSKRSGIGSKERMPNARPHVHTPTSSPVQPFADFAFLFSSLASSFIGYRAFSASALGTWHQALTHKPARAAAAVTSSAGHHGRRRRAASGGGGAVLPRAAAGAARGGGRAPAQPCRGGVPRCARCHPHCCPLYVCVLCQRTSF